MATIRLTQDFREFLQLLNDRRIDYLLIGGYAVAIYGYVRATKDMDLWLAADSDSQDKLIEVLAEFGFPRSEIPRPLFTAEKTVLRMGVPPNRLELLSRITGADFRDCFARRQIVEIDGIDVPVIPLDDLLKNKRSTGRISDQVDVESLEKRQQQKKKKKR
jgi:predicted nucleotidyltransferase